jgi:serine acetyltransferase
VPPGATVAGVPAEVVSTDGREEYDYLPDEDDGNERVNV